MTINIQFFKISKNKKLRFFLMSQGFFSPKIRFLGRSKGVPCSSGTDRRTDRRTDRHESQKRGHLFRVSGFLFQMSLQPIIKEQSNLNIVAGNTFVGARNVSKIFYSFFINSVEVLQAQHGMYHLYPVRHEKLTN